MLNHINYYLYFYAVFLLNGCSGYNITVNDHPISTDQAHLEVTEIADQALSNCIQQTINDRDIASNGGLKLLICTNAGIANLDGIETYFGLERISFSGNKLTAVAALSLLPKLRYLNIEDNPQLNCDHVLLIKKTLGVDLELILPGHCA